MQIENLDEQRRFQRIPVQKPFKAKDKAGKALEQADCMRIPRNVVREAREVYEEAEPIGPIAAVRQFVGSLFTR